jgi:lysophospholipase L1-like esterase
LDIKQTKHQRPRILLLGDSLAVNRKEVGYRDTYCYLLQEELKDYHFINNASRGFTINHIYSMKDWLLLEGFNPTCLILHYGIVDCYPRPIPSGRKMSYVYQNLAHLRINIDGILKFIGMRERLSNLFNFKSVKPTVFKKKTKQIISLAESEGVKKTIILGIIPPKKILTRVKCAKKNIAQYNDIFKTISKENDNVVFIDNSEFVDDDVLWDGHHLSIQGMEKMYMKLLKILKQDIEHGF